MTARPPLHPDPIDPHAAVGRLIEAFDEVLDLRQHLLIPHGLGRLVDVHHHGPLEVGAGAPATASRRWNVARRRAVAEAQPQCRADGRS
jgi:hypothetical protein